MTRGHVVIGAVQDDGVSSAGGRHRRTAAFPRRGDPARPPRRGRSTRHRELRRPSGFDDELRVVPTGATGTWRALTLQREGRRPRFIRAETQLMASLAAPLADGVRQATLLGGAADDDAGPGLLVLAPDYSLVTANQAGLRWLDELGAETGGRLPVALRGVAVRAHEIAQGERTGGTGAWARIRTRTGRWAVVQGSLLGDGPDAAVAVLDFRPHDQLGPKTILRAEFGG